MLKIVLGALALVIAAPAVAQAGPAADPHAEHAEHVQQGSEQQQQQGHAGHGDRIMDCCKDCCDEAKQEGERMSCCDKHGEAAQEGAADHSQHSD